MKESADFLSKSALLWLRGKDLNQRPPGYEPDELPAALPRDIFLSFIKIAQAGRIVKREMRKVLDSRSAGREAAAGGKKGRGALRHRTAKTDGGRCGGRAEKTDGGLAAAAGQPAAGTRRCGQAPGSCRPQRKTEDFQGFGVSGLPFLRRMVYNNKAFICKTAGLRAGEAKGSAPAFLWER